MRSTIAVVNEAKLRRNINKVKTLAPNSDIMAIVKANAYGHGAVEMSRVLRLEDVKFLAVAFPEEGIELRNAGDTGNIIVLVPAHPEEADIFCKYNLQPITSSIDFMIALSEAAVKNNVTLLAHLFIGTGMNREGIEPKKTLQFMRACEILPNIEISGICTHFATSSSDPDFMQKQLDLFNSTRTKLELEGFSFKYIHTSNSGAIVNFPPAQFNLVRPGIALYGYPPSFREAEKLGVEPILTLKSKVILCRRVKAGESVGYDRLFITDKPTNIATVPIGYGDGYLKTLTGKTQVLIKGNRYDVVGSICMDELMVNVGDDDIAVGEEVILIGEQSGEKILADELAKRAGSIVWDVLTAISARVPRVFVE